MIILPDWAKDAMVEAAYQCGWDKKTFIQHSLEKYCRELPPEPCVEELKGKERGLMVQSAGCKCEGCRQQALYTFFIAARARIFNQAKP